MFFAPAQRIHVGARHHPIHLGAQPAPAHRRPAHHLDGQLGVHRGQHLQILDQIGAIHDRLKRPIIDLAGRKQRTHLRQPLAHRAGIAQPAGRQTLADPQRRGHLGGHRLHRVDRLEHLSSVSDQKRRSRRYRPHRLQQTRDNTRGPDLKPTFTPVHYIEDTVPKTPGNIHSIMPHPTDRRRPT